MARRARESGRARCRWVDVDRVGPGRRVGWKEAGVAGWIRARSVSVARRARKRSAGFGVAARAVGGARRGQRDPRRTRRCPVVATPACVGVLAVQHGGPARRAQERAVPTRRARVDDVRRVNGGRKRGAAAHDPSGDRRKIAGAQKPLMRRFTHRGDHGGARITRKRRGIARGRHTANGPQKRRGAPARGGRGVAMARDAVGLKNRGDVGVVDGGLASPPAILRAIERQDRQRDEASARGRSLQRAGDVAPTGHCGRIATDTGVPPIATIES